MIDIPDAVQWQLQVVFTAQCQQIGVAIGNGQTGIGEQRMARVHRLALRCLGEQDSGFFKALANSRHQITDAIVVDAHQGAG